MGEIALRSAGRDGQLLARHTGLGASRTNALTALPAIGTVLAIGLLHGI
jgi:hypothetical protein